MDSQINVKIKHLSGKMYEIKIDPSQTVIDLKTALEKESSVEKSLIKLIFKGKILKNDSEKLSDLKIADGATLHMVKNKVSQTTTTAPSNLSF